MQYFLLGLVTRPQNVTSILFVQHKLVPFPACLPLALLREERLLLQLCGGITMGFSSSTRLCQVTGAGEGTPPAVSVIDIYFALHS